MIIYSKSQGNTDAAIGKLETPIKMIIEHESDLLSKKKGVASALFNIEKSNRFGETIVGEEGFDVFQATEEGAEAAQDTVSEIYKKFIEHIQYTKEFVISAEMMEDAQYGIASDTRRRAESFVRAYYKTINKICETALINGAIGSATFAGARLDLSTYDGTPLFSGTHYYRNDAAEQSNYYYGDIFYTTSGGVRTPSVERFEESLAALTIHLRNMKDEQGNSLGYTADTIILPGNRPVAESIVKKVCGSLTGFNGKDELNLNYGKWNIVILPNWAPATDALMLMSSEANKNLCGNMFFNRVPLNVTNWVDNHTGNYIWNGRCRFGVGFGSYKHILLAVDNPDFPGTASELF